MLDPAPIGFRRLEVADLPQLFAWFSAPHARRWFHRGRTLDDVVTEYTPYIAGTTPIHAYVVTYAGKDIGSMEWSRFGDFPDFMTLYAVTDPDACNCDILIGDAAYVHRGLGAHVVLRFLHDIVFARGDITACFIDPDVDNAPAIRAYEKAGFTFAHRVPDDGDGRPLHLMVLRALPDRV